MLVMIGHLGVDDRWRLGEIVFEQVEAGASRTGDLHGQAAASLRSDVGHRDADLPGVLSDGPEHLAVSACLAALELSVIGVLALAAIDHACDRDIVVAAARLPAYQPDPDGHRSLAIADEDSAAWSCPLLVD